MLQNLICFDMDVQEALDMPRGFATGGIFEAEAGIPDSVLADLAGMGHQVARASTPFGGGQIIEIDPARGILKAASDFRKDGCALAF